VIAAALAAVLWAAVAAGESPAAPGTAGRTGHGALLSSQCLEVDLALVGDSSRLLAPWLELRPCADDTVALTSWRLEKVGDDGCDELDACLDLAWHQQLLLLRLGPERPGRASRPFSADLALGSGADLLQGLYRGGDGVVVLRPPTAAGGDWDLAYDLRLHLVQAVGPLAAPGLPAKVRLAGTRAVRREERWLGEEAVEVTLLGQEPVEPMLWPEPWPWLWGEVLWPRRRPLGEIAASEPRTTCLLLDGIEVAAAGPEPVADGSPAASRLEPGPGFTVLLGEQRPDDEQLLWLTSDGARPPAGTLWLPAGGLRGGFEHRQLDAPAAVTGVIAAGVIELRPAADGTVALDYCLEPAPVTAAAPPAPPLLGSCRLWRMEGVDAADVRLELARWWFRPWPGPARWQRR
jgi:hypothetical protein